MDITKFFEHWGIQDNPFRGEEARQDDVFNRVGLPTKPDQAGPATHSDFEKILGELSRPATSIVFGEKGSGKTAIRMQIAERVLLHNARSPDAATFVIAYDDLNPFLDQFTRASDGSTSAKRLSDYRLVDHMDAVLAIGTTGIVSGVLGQTHELGGTQLASDSAKRLRKAPETLRRDLQLLQACYDLDDTDGTRAMLLRKQLRLSQPGPMVLWKTLALLGWIPAVLAIVLFFLTKVSADSFLGTTLLYSAAGLFVLYGAVLFKRSVLDRLVRQRLAKRVLKQTRCLPRVPNALVPAFSAMDPKILNETVLPLSDSDEPRYAMLARLRRIVAHLGFSGTIVLIDRVDEPTLINGDADRMRSVIWPMFNNKFLQQPAIGFKMLLPIELRYALFRESSNFFQEARLDKQNLIERLAWTGAMLYDLCNMRLAACRSESITEGQANSQASMSLVDMFAEDVTRQDLVDALDQMHQPRDAFKFLYRCINEHCSNVTTDQNEWRIPKLVLESTRKAESDRVQQLYRGIRPA